VGKIGYGKTRKQIKIIAKKVATEKEVLRTGKISDGWLTSFTILNCHYKKEIVPLRHA